MVTVCPGKTVNSLAPKASDYLSYDAQKSQDFFSLKEEQFSFKDDGIFCDKGFLAIGGEKIVKINHFSFLVYKENLFIHDEKSLKLEQLDIISLSNKFYDDRTERVNPIVSC